MASNKIKDLTGKVFGEWKVVSFAGLRRHASTWRCLCSGCSKIVVVLGASLLNGSSLRCMKCSRKKNSPRLQLIGNIYGNFKVVSLEKMTKGNSFWNCLCLGCEKLFIVKGASLVCGAMYQCAACAGKERSNKAKEDLTGRLFGNWKCVSYSGGDDGRWLCECLCGSGVNKALKARDLKRNQTLGCDKCRTLRILLKFAKEAYNEVAEQIRHEFKHHPERFYECQT